MSKELKVTTSEFIEGLLDLVTKVQETLLAARQFVSINDDMKSDGGEPFLADDKLFGGPCNHDDSLGHVMDAETAEMTAAYEDAEANWGVDPNPFGRYDPEKFPALIVSSTPPTPVDEAPPRRKRAKILRRTTVTDNLKLSILAALDRDDRSTMKEIDDEFMVSQSTVSRLYRESKRESEDTRTSSGTGLTRTNELSPDDPDVRLRPTNPMDEGTWKRRPIAPIPGQKELPV